MSPIQLFTKEPDPSYVPAFAARLTLGIGQGIARARSEIKQVLLQEDISGIWTLAMLLVQWYADMLPPREANAVVSTLQEFAMQPLVSNLNLFRERLLPFVRTAHQAQNPAQLAAAGVYFAAAVEQIGIQTLSWALKAGPVADLQKRLLVHLPLPTGLKEEYARALASTITVPPKTFRGEQFDRTDFSVSTPRAPSQPLPASLKPPTPQLAAGDVTRAYLHTQGWEGKEVDDFLAGPNRNRKA